MSSSSKDNRDRDSYRERESYRDREGRVDRVGREPRERRDRGRYEDRDVDRYLEENNLYISNLSYNTKDEDMEKVFQPFGHITHCKIIRDHNSGKSRGFGFVTFKEAAEAEKAKNALDNTDLDDRKIRIEIARRSGGRKPSPRRDRHSPRRDRSPRRSPRRDRRSPRRSYRSDRYKSSPRRSSRSPRNRSPRQRDRRSRS